MKFIIKIFLFFIFVPVAFTYSQSIESKLLTDSTILFQKAEFNIYLTATWEDPYLCNDVMLDMKITTPTGKLLSLPCYYESGSSGKNQIWKARFTPQEVGVYNYYFMLFKNGKSISNSKTKNFSVAKSNDKGFLSVNNNWSLRYDNGDIFRGIGENIGWESRVNDDSKYFRELHENPKFNYERMLRKLSNNGGNFFRTWMCAWNLPLEWKKVTNSNRYANSKEHFNLSMMPRMDRLTELCDSLGIHMMLSLDVHGNFLGGGWENNNYNILNGGVVKTAKEFFTNPKAKELYKSRLRYLVARWGYSPSIAAWELFNEIDNAMYNGKTFPEISDSIITEWHKEMSSYLKSIDPFKHILTTSISHRDVQGLNSISTIDINQKHIYVNVNSIPSTIISYSEKYNKPYVIGEFANQWDWNLNFNDYAEDFDYDFKRGLWYGLFSPTPILPMTWWWEFFDYREMTKYYAIITKINQEMISSGKGEFVKINLTPVNKSTKLFGVKCGSSSFIYILNDSDSTITENLSIPFDEVLNHVRTFSPQYGLFVDYSLKPELKEEKVIFSNIQLKSREDLIIILEE